MPSEQRLHPASILFAFGDSLKRFALPGLLVLVTARGSSGGPDGSVGYLPRDWELGLMLLLIPGALAAVARYLSFRVRYDGTELVIRSGILFRNERHVPYARIQNLDAVQNVVHRLLDVVEVRVETGGGKEPEARISVLPAAAFTEMRRRVFEGRGQAPPDAVAAPEPTAAPSQPSRSLLHLSLRELLLFGFLENRGLVVIGAAYGVAWELGLLRGLWGGIFDNQSPVPYVVPTGLIEAVATGGPLSFGRIVMLLAGIGGLLIAVRVISMGWGAVRLHDFHLTRAGEDLHTRFGLLTRVSATIPLRRVQTLTIRQAPLHRIARRFSVQVETAGSAPGSGRGKSEREWLAPIIRATELPGLVREIVPEIDLAALDWQQPHARAFRRAVKPGIVAALATTAILAAPLGWWALGALPLAMAWAIVAARKRVGHLAWASTEDVVVFRSGWLWRSLTIARVAKIQAVAQHESPFDRRTSMARVRVDTAGGSERSHRVDIPYLAREVAFDLRHRLAAHAARTTFNTQ